MGSVTWYAAISEGVGGYFEASNFSIFVEVQNFEKSYLFT